MTSSGVLSLVRMSNLVCALTFRICRSSSRSSAPEVFSPVMTRSKCLALTVANASQLLSARSTSQVGSMDATCVAISGSGPTTRAVRRGVDGGSETSNDIELADSTGPPFLRFGVDHPKARSGERVSARLSPHDCQKAQLWTLISSLPF